MNTGRFGNKRPKSKKSNLTTPILPTEEVSKKIASTEANDVLNETISAKESIQNSDQTNYSSETVQKEISRIGATKNQESKDTFNDFMIEHLKPKGKKIIKQPFPVRIDVEKISEIDKIVQATGNRQISRNTIYELLTDYALKNKESIIRKLQQQ